jgi:hypothetical protein
MSARIFQTSKQFIDEIANKAELDQISFLVAYGKDNAEPRLIAPGDGLAYQDDGQGDFSTDCIIQNKLIKMSIKTTVIVHAYSNPRCQILTASGQWARVC